MNKADLIVPNVPEGAFITVKCDDYHFEYHYYDLEVCEYTKSKALKKLKYKYTKLMEEHLLLAKEMREVQPIVDDAVNKLHNGFDREFNKSQRARRSFIGRNFIKLCNRCFGVKL
jgi:hypothetical protein